MRQVASDSSLVSLDNQANSSFGYSRTRTVKSSSNIRERAERAYPTYFHRENHHSELQISKNNIQQLIVNKHLKVTTTSTKMRGTSLRNSGRPANSMEQDSFDSFDDMEDMLVMSANNSLNLNSNVRLVLCCVVTLPINVPRSNHPIEYL